MFRLFKGKPWKNLRSIGTIVQVDNITPSGQRISVITENGHSLEESALEYMQKQLGKWNIKSSHTPSGLVIETQDITSVIKAQRIAEQNTTLLKSYISEDNSRCVELKGLNIELVKKTQESLSNNGIYAEMLKRGHHPTLFARSESKFALTEEVVRHYKDALSKAQPSF